MTNTAHEQYPEIPLNDTKKVCVDLLKLDRENPRLVGVDPRTTDEGIIAQLYRGEELSELLQSISANGYLDIEPLVVWLAPGDEKLTVLEGNRRLAAIKLFRDPSLIDRIVQKDRLRISLPTISDKKLRTLDRISVYRVVDRDAARSFIGFKHINGPAKWESYAKAKFAAEWYKSGDVTLEEIAEKIGDRHDTIKRMVAAIYVLNQAEHEDLFRLSDRKATKFNFSHLYTALSRSTYMTYLGLENAWARYDPEPNPISHDKLDRLREVLIWIYGSKQDDKEPLVQSQNPDIKNLGEAVNNAEAVHILRAGGTLAEAHASTRPAEETFSAALIRARSTLREATNSLRGYNGRDQSLLDIAEDISETAQTIFGRMKKKQKDVIGENHGS